MTDKFLGSSGSVNLSDGTVDIYAKSLKSENLTAGMPVKTDGKKNIVSEYLTPSDIIGLELNKKDYIEFIQGIGHTPDLGNISLYAKYNEDRLFFQDGNSVEHQMGDVFTTNTSTNKSLAIYQGTEGKHLTDSNITYDSNTSGLNNVGVIQNGTAEVLLSQTGDITLAATNVYSNANLQMSDHSIKFVDGANTSTIEPSAYLEIKDENRIKLSKFTGGANFYDFPLTLDPFDPAVFRNYVDFDYQTSFKAAILNESYLEIQGSFGVDPTNLMHKQISIRHPNSTVSGWWIGSQRPTPSTSDNDLYFSVTYSNGATHIPGFIQDSVLTPTAMNFSGQHRTYTELKYDDSMIGKLMVANGNYMNMLKVDEECTTQSCIKINDAHPVVELCDEIASKRCFGVCAGLEEEKRTWSSGAFNSIFDKAEGDNRIYCNGVGEGSILVIDGVVYENGDLLQSYYCYGNKQSDDIIRSTTVAKITCDIDFDNIPTEDVKIYKGSVNGVLQWNYLLNPDGTRTQQDRYNVKTIELNGETRQVALVGCVYMMS